jgi:citrate synthase
MEQAQLTVGDKQLSLPVIEGSEGEKGIDISKLRGQTGYITLDPGFVNTGSCQSSVTFIDGEEGILRYRGYALEDLCEKCDFLETSYLLINGTLPTQSEYDTFVKELEVRTELAPGVGGLLNAMPKGTHPMAASSAVVSCLSGYNNYDVTDADATYGAMLNLMAKFPMIAAGIYRAGEGKSLNDPKPGASYAGNFLNAMFNDADKPYEIDPEIAKALDLLLILHADHEQNCSAATVRVVGSSQANLYASVVGGINALWGPLHGGANQAVLEMLGQIHEAGGDVDKFIARAKDKDDPFRLMGFGHRVYKNFDPRARIIKKHADRVLEILNLDDPLLNLAKQLEEKALADSYFVDRKLYPNVDFFSGIIYKALGIPTEMFTVMFALGRMPGWIAQWREHHKDPKARISRPRQIYTGETLRDVQSHVAKG